MKKLKEYIKEVLGIEVDRAHIEQQSLDKVPFYIRQSFDLDLIGIYNNKLVIAEVKSNRGQLTVSQVEKQLDAIKEIFHENAILVINELSANERKRFIKKGVNFIVPGKQMFLPDLMIDLRESHPKRVNKREKLLPSAQYIILYNILNREDNVKKYSFKQLAGKLNYTQMAITNAAENLQYHELCVIEGTKEKYIHFNGSIPELWNKALPLFINPVLKTVYSDDLPGEIIFFNSNISALAEYSDITPGRQQYRAIEKGRFYSLEKSDQIRNQDEREGEYCLEIWKYDPGILVKALTDKNNVDPLSLYLSLIESTDERVAAALEQIIEKYIW